MNLDAIKKLLMPYEEYQSKRFSSPYKYKIIDGDQKLFYFGSNHSTDPKNKQYEDLVRFWKDFLKQTSKKKSLVLIEGGLRRLLSSEDESIKTNAEAGLMTFLAGQVNLETASPEPDRKSEIGGLLDEFSKDEIQFYYFARMVFQWTQLGLEDGPTLERYCTPS